jgi:hypothetical protein
MRLMWAVRKMRMDARGNAICGDSFCPRPLSRKKLRSILRHNRSACTANALFSAHGRKPGPGKFKRAGLRQLDKLEKEILVAGEEHRENLLRNRVLQLLRGWMRR